MHKIIKILKIIIIWSAKQLKESLQLQIRKMISRHFLYFYLEQSFFYENVKQLEVQKVIYGDNNCICYTQYSKKHLISRRLKWLNTKKVRPSWNLNRMKRINRISFQQPPDKPHLPRTHFTDDVSSTRQTPSNYIQSYYIISDHIRLYSKTSLEKDVLFFHVFCRFQTITNY